MVIICSKGVRGVLPREVAQAITVPTTLDTTELGSGDVGKEMPRVEPVNVCSLGRTCLAHLKKLIPGCLSSEIP